MLKIVSTIAFIAWRIFGKRGLLHSCNEVSFLDAYWLALKNVQSTADFMFDAALDIFCQALMLRMTSKVFDNIEEPSENELKLVALAAGGNRRRINFFNGKKSIGIRLHISGRTLKKGGYYYCSLCSEHCDSKGPDGKNWRGHRSVITCQLCSANLCVRVHKGLRKSC